MKDYIWWILASISFILSVLFIGGVFYTLNGLNYIASPDGKPKPDWPEIIWAIFFIISTILLSIKASRTEPKSKK
jgi:hypothetical protein